MINPNTIRLGEPHDNRTQPKILPRAAQYSWEVAIPAARWRRCSRQSAQQVAEDGQEKHHENGGDYPWCHELLDRVVPKARMASIRAWSPPWSRVRWPCPRRCAATTTNPASTGPVPAPCRWKPVARSPSGLRTGPSGGAAAGPGRLRWRNRRRARCAASKSPTKSAVPAPYRPRTGDA